MKFLLTFACVAICVAVISGFNIPDDMKEKMMAVKKECLAEVPNVNKDHLEKFEKNEFVEGDEDLKKLAWCFHRKSGCQNEDGSYNVQLMKDNLANLFGNHDNDKIVDECTKDDHHDAVENGWALTKCMKTKFEGFE